MTGYLFIEYGMKAEVKVDGGSDQHGRLYPHTKIKSM